MAEEFQAAVCGGTWWMNTTKSMFGGCSSPISDVGSFGWGGATSTCEESIITSVSHDRRGHNGDVLIGSIPIMDFRLSQVENYSSMVQEEIMNPESAKNWSPEDNISSTTDFLLDPLNSVTSAGNSPEFPPVCSASSILLQSLLEPDHHHHAQPQPFFNNQSMNYMSDYNESSPPWSKSSISRQQQPAVADASGTGNLHFSNNTQFWNASTASTIVNEIKTPSSQPQFLTNFDQEKHNRLTLMNKINSEEVRDARAVTKRGSNTNTDQPAFKRARIETPSPLPTFKVRKEKMGDRITALQQLVSPFGKTDTASVLQEAIEYIKFLHDQVSVLSTPYMKQGAPVQNQQIMDKLNDLDQGSKQDLKSGGLCLVPISSTFPVANETTVDFWTPTFGGTFR